MSVIDSADSLPEPVMSRVVTAARVELVAFVRSLLLDLAADSAEDDTDVADDRLLQPDALDASDSSGDELAMQADGDAGEELPLSQPGEAGGSSDVIESVDVATAAPTADAKSQEAKWGRQGLF